MDLIIRGIIIIIIVGFFSCFLNKNGVEGTRELFMDEDLELEKQVNLINKAPVKSFQTKYGYIYDCIDFYKQPAFDHPLLKNHTFHHQMKPSSMPKLARNKEDIKNGHGMKLPSVSCPVGTVPIRRVTKNDLMRFKAQSEGHSSNYNALTGREAHYAVVRTNDPTLKYIGGSTIMTVYNISVLDSQYSSARMKVQNGRDSIEVGWTVNPTLYGDHNTHLYIYKNTRLSRCFNTQCDDFIIVNNEFPIDGTIEAVSERGGVQRSFRSMIFRDPSNGDWWLALGSDNLTQIGFWPQKIFTDLVDLATSVSWGGEVFSPIDAPSPPMGSGHFVLGTGNSTGLNAYCGAISTINESNQVVDATNTVEDADVYSIYQVADIPISDNRHLVLFGGPGGITSI